MRGCPLGPSVHPQNEVVLPNNLKAPLDDERLTVRLRTFKNGGARVTMLHNEHGDLHNQSNMKEPYVKGISIFSDQPFITGIKRALTSPVGVLSSVWRFQMRMIGEIFSALFYGVIIFFLIFFLLDWVGTLISPKFIYGAGFGILVMLILNEKRGRR